MVSFCLHKWETYSHKYKSSDLLVRVLIILVFFWFKANRCSNVRFNIPPTHIFISFNQFFNTIVCYGIGCCLESLLLIVYSFLLGFLFFSDLFSCFFILLFLAPSSVFLVLTCGVRFFLNVAATLIALPTASDSLLT